MQVLQLWQRNLSWRFHENYAFMMHPETHIVLFHALTQPSAHFIARRNNLFPRFFFVHIFCWVSEGQPFHLSFTPNWFRMPLIMCCVCCDLLLFHEHTTHTHPTTATMMATWAWQKIKNESKSETLFAVLTESVWFCWKYQSSSYWLIDVFEYMTLFLLHAAND